VSEISILLVGNTKRSEFRRARAALDALGRVRSAADVESAAAALTDGQFVADVIVITQSYPTQFSHEAVDHLRRLAPLARVLGLLGSWCEGEMRTGKPWPAAIRLYWHQWPLRCEGELRRMQRDLCSPWGLPITATDEERLLLEVDDPLPDQQGLIAIYTRRYEMEDWLSAAFRSRGCSTVWLRPPRPARVEGATAAIFDGSDCRGEELEELKHLAATLASVPIIALLDFPRIEDTHSARSAGAAAVLSKPLYVDDLFRQLNHLLAKETAEG